METSIQAGEPTCCVWVDFVSASLPGTAWFKRFRGGSLLEHCCEGLLRAPAWPLVLIANQGDRQTAAVAEQCGAFLYRANSRHIAAGVAEAALHRGAARIFVAHGFVGLGFVPAEFLDALISGHIESGADITMATDLPAPLYAIVCEGEVLRTVAELTSSLAMLDDLSQVLRVVAQASQAEHGVSFRQACVAR